MSSFLRLFTEVRRQLLIRRRLLAALCAAAAAFTAVQVLRPAPPPLVEVWVLDRDVDVGAPLLRSDLRLTRVAAGSAPRPRVRDPSGLLGRIVIVPLQRGQPLIAGALLGRGAARHYPGRTVLTVRLDQDVGALLRAGDRIDLWSTDARATGATSRVAAGVLVVAVPRHAGETIGPSTTGRVLTVLAVPTVAAGPVASAAALGFLSIAWNR